MAQPLQEVKSLDPTLTRRELWTLHDQLGREQFLVAKFEACVQNLNDPELQDLCSEIAQRHRQHFDTLLQHLDANSDQGGE